MSLIIRLSRLDVIASNLYAIIRKTYVKLFIFLSTKVACATEGMQQQMAHVGYRNLLGGMRVLVVEDHYYLAEEMRHMIMRLGGLVLAPVNSVSAALEIIKSNEVDAVILDLNLNGEASYQVADLLLTKCVPFAFATGYDAAEIDPRYAAVPHVEKPIKFELLAKALSDAIHSVRHDSVCIQLK